MLLLPSTTNHTVGVMGEVLCMPVAQLSFGPFGVVLVIPFAPGVPADGEPAAPPITKPPGLAGAVGVSPGVAGVAGVAPDDVLALLGRPPRFAEPVAVGLLPLQAATKVALISAASMLAVSDDRLV
jgi:hypothetical protein